MIKRDYTNQFGYVCPTENEAIRNADRKPEPPRKPSPGVMREEDIKAMDKHRKAQSMVEFVTAVKTEPKDAKSLKRARALKTAMVMMASCAEFECVMQFRLKDKRTGKVYEHDEL